MSILGKQVQTVPPPCTVHYAWNYKKISSALWVVGAIVHNSRTSSHESQALDHHLEWDNTTPPWK